MSRDIVDEIDDMLADWNGSTDSAEWHGDGGHERDSGGEYYALDRTPRWMHIGWTEPDWYDAGPPPVLAAQRSGEAAELVVRDETFEWSREISQWETTFRLLPSADMPRGYGGQWRTRVHEHMLSFGQAWTALAREASGAASNFESLRELLTEAVSESEVRQRALDARRSRSTGPAPRRLDGRRVR